ncbi:MAG: histidine phosphatase family protein [Candidatus Peribacteria bacterium]|nr:histidine phosphatase family protein [Candidatus Peribacteria bacterium]
MEILQKENIDVIFSSPFKRCLSTINPLAKKIGKEVIIDDRLKEINVRKLD